MAFTTAEKVSITKITGVDVITLDAVLAAYADHLSADHETAVRDEIERWSAVSGDFTSIEPKESNRGVRVNSSDEKADIRRNIANLLWLGPYVTTGAAQGVLVRG